MTIAFPGAMAAALEIRIVGVWPPLHFLRARPLAGSSAASMADILGTFGAKGADIRILWVFLLDIDKLSTLDTCNLDSIAVATCPAMRFVLPVHKLVALPGTPLDSLVCLRGPLVCPGTACM